MPISDVTPPASAGIFPTTAALSWAPSLRFPRWAVVHAQCVRVPDVPTGGVPSWTVSLVRALLVSLLPQLHCSRFLLHAPSMLCSAWRLGAHVQRHPRPPVRPSVRRVQRSTQHVATLVDFVRELPGALLPPTAGHSYLRRSPCRRAGAGLAARRARHVTLLDIIQEGSGCPNRIERKVLGGLLFVASSRWGAAGERAGGLAGERTE